MTARNPVAHICRQIGVLLSHRVYSFRMQRTESLQHCIMCQRSQLEPKFVEHYCGFPRLVFSASLLFHPSSVPRPLPSLPPPPPPVSLSRLLWLTPRSTPFLVKLWNVLPQQAEQRLRLVARLVIVCVPCPLSRCCLRKGYPPQGRGRG